MKAVVAFVLVIVCVVNDVHGYPDGAPRSACGPARPLHTSETTGMMYTPLPLGNKYRFVPSATEFVAGKTVTVTIEASANNTVNGFFLQARKVSDNTSVGGFEDLPAKSKLRPCARDDDAVTHTDSTTKEALSFTWRAPNDPDIGNISFVGSVALNHDDFFVGITSVELAQMSGADILRPSFILMTLIPIVSHFI